MNEDDDNAEEKIPLKNLPDSGLKVFTYEPWEPGESVKANNVLIGSLDILDRATVIGRDKNNFGMFIASTVNNPREVIEDLHEFISFLEREYIDGSDY